MGNEYAIKIMYADWVNRDDRIAFPQKRYDLAANMTLGTLCLIYLTGPIKRIVTASKITGTIHDGQKKWPTQEIEFPRWPYVVPHERLLPYKVGLSLEDIREIGVPKFRPRPGDTYYQLIKIFMKECLNYCSNSRILTGKSGC